MIAVLAYVGIAGLVLSLAIGILGAVMATRSWPAHAADCRARNERPGLIWSSRYLDTIEPEHRRLVAKRGVLLFSAGLAGAVLFFPFVLLSGLAS